MIVSASRRITGVRLRITSVDGDSGGRLLATAFVAARRVVVVAATTTAVAVLDGLPLPFRLTGRYIFMKKLHVLIFFVGLHTSTAAIGCGQYSVSCGGGDGCRIVKRFFSAIRQITDDVMVLVVFVVDLVVVVVVAKRASVFGDASCTADVTTAVLTIPIFAKAVRFVEQTVIVQLVVFDLTLRVNTTSILRAVSSVQMLSI